MSTYPTVTSFDWNKPIFPVSGTYFPTVKEEEEKSEIITIDDIYDVDTVITCTEKSINSSNALTSLSALLGITPSITLNKNLTINLIISTLISAVISTWVSASFYLSVFLVFNFINLISSIFLDKKNTLRTKITTFGADLFFVGVLATMTDILLNRIKIPFVDTNSFYVGLLATLMSINYIVLISKRGYHLTSISKGNTVINIMKAISKGIDNFRELQEDDARHRK